MAPSTYDIDRFYREEFGRILATLIRVLGDFDRAEEAAHDAFAAALEQWDRDGVPDNPRAWIIGVARHKVIDRIRRAARFDLRRDELIRMAESDTSDAPDGSDAFADERLRLIFTCCHPALADDAKVALSLHTLCGLKTEEIAHAFLTAPTTMAQRLVRAKRKIRAANIPYEVPSPELLAERLQSVMAVVYLVFNEGYTASSGDRLMRTDLSAEAIRLARVLVELMPTESEPRGLLAMMLLHDSRRDTRVDEHGEMVLLEHQDRSRWDRAQIAEGLALAERALQIENAGPYAIQAAIVAEHSRAADAETTDWKRIAELYARLHRLQPSPVIELNRAVAIAMAEGADVGLALIDSIANRGDLHDYHLMWAARADLLRRLGRFSEAAESYTMALGRVGSAPERQFLRRQLDEVMRHGSRLG
ncbi:MAG: RNA polymerase sigma factor [Candidatus Binatus sp.]|nr:RNA polymerase sigma factor [Candidatus Binatus sp.]